MKKTKILIFIILSLFFKISFAENIENVFSDIDKNYKYYNELQSLYDKWMISPERDSKFNPYSLIKRDDFVWITMEVNCRKCIQPNTPSPLILKYSWTIPFFDVEQYNKNFYCISDWKDNDFVVWYDKSYTCDDWTTKSWESPFCINNNITREEALAIMLRKSSIFSVEDSNNIINQIKSWVIKDDLSNDVKARLDDWSIYTFYWYFKKALEYSLVEYDVNWNQKIYKLIEKDSNWNLNPKKAITKEEFLKRAYILFKANSCNPVNYNNDLNLALDFDILDKSCNKTKTCINSDLKNTKENTYDFKPIIWWACDLGVDEKSIVRQLYNEDTKASDIIYWDYIDNYKFNDLGHRKITLIVTDKCWNKRISTSNLLVTNDKNSNLSVDIIANPIIWNAYLDVDFDSIISKPDDVNCSYSWNFWDSYTAFWKQTEHVYKTPWVYKATLDVVCDDWQKWSSSVMIKVLDMKTCSIDSDNDWVTDCNDKCPLIYGDKNNYWCPIISYKSIDTNIGDSCLYPSSGSSIFWNVMCSSCPCSYNLDFLATLRKCDNTFPAIISPDKSTIYSKGSNWLIK